MKIVMDRSVELVQWAAERMTVLRGRPFVSDATAIGVENCDGQIMGAVIFHQYQPDHGTIQVSTYAEDARWLLSKEFRRVAHSYAFEGCGCHKIWSATPRSNMRALRMLKVWGMTPEAILAKHYGEEDVVISRKFAWEPRQ